jgi:hypothetical protein
MSVLSVLLLLLPLPKGSERTGGRLYLIFLPFLISRAQKLRTPDTVVTYRDGGCDDGGRTPRPKLSTLSAFFTLLWPRDTDFQEYFIGYP